MVLVILSKSTTTSTTIKLIGRTIIQFSYEPNFYLLDKEQGFICEINIRIGKKPSTVLFLNQTTVDLNAPSNYFSLLSTDTTYQISEHYLTQTAYENLSLLWRDTLQSSWFLGVCILHREEAFENFDYLSQVAKRANSSLSSLRELGTDDNKAIYDTILSECDGCTHHLFGLEHFRKNITDKLQKFSPDTSQNNLQRLIWDYV